MSGAAFLKKKCCCESCVPCATTTMTATFAGVDPCYECSPGDGVFPPGQFKWTGGTFSGSFTLTRVSTSPCRYQYEGAYTAHQLTWYGSSPTNGDCTDAVVNQTNMIGIYLWFDQSDVSVILWDSDFHCLVRGSSSAGFRVKIFDSVGLPADTCQALDTAANLITSAECDAGNDGCMVELFRYTEGGTVALSVP